MDRRDQRPVRDPRGPPVVRDRPADGHWAPAPELGPRGQDLGDARVQPLPLTGEQLGCGRLAHQGVTEAVRASVRLRGQQPVADGLAQGLEEAVVRQARDRGEQLVVDALPDRGGDAHDLPRVIADLAEPRQQHVLERRRDRGAVARCGQLLGDVRVALRALEDLLGQLSARRRAEDPCEQRVDLRAREARQIDSLDLPGATDP